MSWRASRRAASAYSALIPRLDPVKIQIRPLKWLTMMDTRLVTIVLNL
jgi:hypothetical protein